MATGDKLWFELGVRDSVSKSLSDILEKAEELQDVMSSIMIGKDAIRNAQELEQALDKIAVARSRIAESKSKTSDRSELDSLKSMDKELSKIQKKFINIAKGGSDITEAMLGTKGFASFIKMNENLVLALDQVRRKTGEINAAALERERNDAREASRLDMLKEKYYALSRARTSLQDAILNAAPGTDTTSAVSLLNSITARMGAVLRSQANGYATPESVIGSEYEELMRRAKEQTRSLSNATDEYNRKLSTTENIQRSLLKTRLDAESQQRIAQIRKQSVEYTALGQKIREITALMNQLAAEEAALKNGTISKPTMTTDVVNARLDAIQRSYNEAIARGRQLEKDDAEAKNQKAAASKKAADAIQLIAHANQGLISSYSRVAEAGNQANRITIQLQNQLAGYAGLYGIERILKSVITIGGQFEYQHIALQNILGDIQQANTLFSQLQDLAIESPKTFMELTSYTKQLSAYQIPYAELFDTTKRLADLSAGLGVDMSRLILAYGQVRSAAVLRGQELRQFTEAGIPIVQALADEFTKLNGRATTTGEVFELISKRAVPFEMVKKILWDMTNEGGRFYNMQAELADTLYGKWQKLQDQWQITLGHIADGETKTGWFLKNTLEGIVKLTAAFDTLLPVFGMIGVGKLLGGTTDKMVGLYNKQTGATAIKNMQIAKLKEANRLERERVLFGRELSQIEKEIVVNRNKLVSNDYYILAAENQITAQKAHQLMLDGQMSKEHFYRLLQMQGYTREQRKQIANGNLQSLQVGGFWKKIGKGALGLMGGWFGVAMAASGAIMSMYNNASQKVSEAKDAAVGANDAMLASLKEVNNYYNELTKQAPSGAEEINAAINRMTSLLKESGAYTDDLQKKIDGATDVSAKYDILYNSLQKVSNEYLKAKENVEAYLEAANRVGEGNWFTKIFNDPMSEDIKDLSAANIEKKVAKNQLNRLGAAMKTNLTAYLESFGKWNEETMGSLNWDELYNKLTVDGKRGFLNMIKNNAQTNADNAKKYWEELADAIKKYENAVDNAASKNKEVDSQLQESVDYWNMALQERASLSGLSFDKIDEWKDDDIRKLNGWINDIVGSMNIDSETADKIKNAIINSLPKEVQTRIKTLPVVDTTPLADWQKDLDNYFKKNKINITVDAQSSLEKIEKDLQNKHKEYQAQMDRAGKILVSFGFDLSSLPDDINKAVESVPFWMRGFVKKVFEDYAEGKSGVAKTKQASVDTGLSLAGSSNSGGSQKDKALETAKNRLDEVKRFYSEYKKYREVYKSDSEAQSMVEAVFSMKPGEGDKIVKDYKGTIRGIIDAFKNSSGERKKFYLSGKQLIGDIDLDEMKKAIDETLKETQEYISKQTEKWNLYKQIFEKTGNKEYAKNAFTDNRVFDDVARELQKKLFTVSGGMPIDYDMSQAAAEKYYENNKAAYELWKKIVDLTDKNWVDALSKGADAYAQLLTTEEKIRKNEEEIARLRKEQPNTPGTNARIRALQKENEKRGYENFQQGSDYVRFFGAVLTMTNDEVERTAQTIKRRLIVELTKGTISARQYTKSLKEVNDQLSKSRSSYRSNMGAFLNKGQNGLVDLRSEEVQNAAIAYEQAKKHREELEKIADTEDKSNRVNLGVAKIEEEEARKRLEIASESYEKSVEALNVMTKMSSVIDVTTSVLDGLQKAMQALADMFAALGDTDTANAFSDMSDATSAITSVFTPVNNTLKSAMNGDVGGVISNAIAAPFQMIASPITAFANLHNKQLERNIEASKKRQAEYEALETALKNRFEKVLGGIYNFKIDSKQKEKLSNLSKYYSSRNPNTSKAFEKAVESESYYDSQYALLLAQRDELERQQAIKSREKGDHKQEIEDYQNQIDELDQQIKTFALDMAKALYDIDIQSWARELTDAVVSAWENGENAVESYKNKVKDLMKDLTKNILAKKVMEVALENAGIDDLVAGLMADSSGKLNEDVVPKIAEALFSVGNLTAEAIEKVLDELEAKGYITKGNGGGGSTSNKVIQGGFTENETGLVLSYMNAMRADLSMQRMDVNSILLSVQQMASRGNFLTAAQEDNLRSIAENTLRTADAVEAVRSLLNGATLDKSRGIYVK